MLFMRNDKTVKEEIREKESFGQCRFLAHRRAYPSKTYLGKVSLCILGFDGGVTAPRFEKKMCPRGPGMAFGEEIRQFYRISE